MTVYQTDDGRRIEMFEEVSRVEYDARAASDEDQAEPEFSDKPVFFAGVVPIMTNQGPKEIKFEIPDVKTIDEAFGQFFDRADKVMEELQSREREMREKANSPKIVAASTQTLQALDEAFEGDEERPGKIII